MPAVIDRFLVELLRVKGSDLQLVSGSCPVMRINGELRKIEELPILKGEQVERMATQIFTEEQMKELQESKNMDFAYQMTTSLGQNRRFRGNAYYQKHGMNIIMRAIPDEVPTLESLGLPKSLENMTHHHQGLILAVGPAGCGKTSTLAALIDIINQKKPVHILTVEDPIEYIFQPKQAIINQRQVGLHVESFQMALKGALREDPDIIFIGELRDLETIQLAITAAETGHLVLGTMHTNSAGRTINRIVDSFPVDQQSQIRTMLSESMKGIIAQKLIPRADGKGRIPALEVLVNSVSVANIIRDGVTFKLESVMQTGMKQGMKMMDTSINQLFERKLITRDDAIANANDPSTFKPVTVPEPVTVERG